MIDNDESFSCNFVQHRLKSGADMRPHLQHDFQPVGGVRFCPESIPGEHARTWLKNFISEDRT